MVSDLFSFSGLLAIQFGFAAFLGGLSGYARQTLDRALVIASLVFYAGASWALPLATSIKVVVCLMSVLLFWGFRTNDVLLRAQPKVAWVYASLAMLLIFVWALAQFEAPLVALAASAGLAAALAWRRSYQIA